MNKINYNHLKIAIPTMGWLLLGFYRGIKSYEYSHDKNNMLYTDKLLYGLGGVLWYINPIGIPLNIIKELYRFEVTIRNLEEEKKTRKYKDL